MAFKESIDKRIKAVSASWKDITSKKMFGGVCYLTAGNMFCGVYKDWLILRLRPEDGERALESPYSRPFDITGRPLKGWVMMDEAGFQTDAELGKWMISAAEYARNLPQKKKRRKE